ncbi:MAG: nucleoside deaminase [Chthoniobacterales bacterium]|jgi:tRNA(Arg) A34 adenosine deaminase TadA|nr:nucleoside deaminase [Chthoniobacterales bacterium]
MDPRIAKAEDENFMRLAIALGEKAALVDGTGGPFGCVIVKDGAVIAEGSNHVLTENDPTWHGEMAAIRAAGKSLGTFNLAGCTLYTSGEPCPMCAGAIFWARIARVVYASTIADALVYGGFDDQPIYEDLAKPIADRHVPAAQCLHEEMLELWRRYATKPDKIYY